MDYISFIGIAAGVLTTISFLPQLFLVVKTKSTKDISLGMFVTFSFGVFCWLTYGILTKSFPLIISNGLVLIFALIILGYKIKYK